MHYSSELLSAIPPLQIIVLRGKKMFYERQIMQHRAAAHDHSNQSPILSDSGHARQTVCR
jgi:hypothetical protein